MSSDFRLHPSHTVTLVIDSKIAWIGSIERFFSDNAFDDKTVAYIHLRLSLTHYYYDVSAERIWILHDHILEQTTAPKVSG